MSLKNVRQRMVVRPGPVSTSQAKKRDALLIRVATEEFLRHGFEGATLATISKRARISKRTLYGMFESKEELFTFVATTSIPKLRSKVERALRSGLSFREIIRSVVVLLINSVRDRSSNSLLKLAIAERDSFPKLADAAWEHSFDIAHPLGAYFQTQVTAGVMTRRQGIRLGYHLMNMANGGYGCLLVDPKKLFANREIWANSVTDLFVAGFPFDMTKASDYEG